MPTTSRIEAEISVPEVIHHPGGRRATIEVDVLTRLHNRSDDAYVVGTSDAADTHHWHVLDENHREITRPKAGPKGKGKKGVHPHASELVSAGHSHSCPATIKLDAKKLKPGKHYTLRYVYHGYVAEADFVVVASPAKAPARKRASGAKKTTRKATARKAPRTAAKKPAKESATKKK